MVILLLSFLHQLLSSFFFEAGSRSSFQRHVEVLFLFIFGFFFFLGSLESTWHSLSSSQIEVTAVASLLKDRRLFLPIPSFCET